MRLIVLALLVAVAAGAAAITWVVVSDRDSVATARPIVVKIKSIAAPVVTTVKTKVRPPRRGRSKEEVEPELEPRTPLEEGDSLISQDVPPTEIGPTTDPSGGPDAFTLVSASRLGDDVNLWRALDIAEPTVAVNGKRMLVTWNRDAAVSMDGGERFRELSPQFAFDKPAAGRRFCCDQIATYVPSADLWVWLLQYDERDQQDNTIGNVLRIATAHGDVDFDSTGFRMQSFLVSPLDIKPLNAARNAWFDYSGMAFTERYLYVAVNVFETDATVVMRFPLEQLASGAKPVPDAVVLQQKTARLASGATDTMYFAQHESSSRLAVYSWADDEASPSGPTSVAHRRYGLAPQRYTCPRTGASTGNWCEREDEDGQITNDDRPTTAWLTGGTLGLAWNAPASPTDGFPFPYVATVLIDTATMKATETSAIWNPGFAYQYAALATNARGEAGGVALAGGGSRFLTCVALLGGQDGHGWEARILDVSDQDPYSNSTGDYLSATPSGATSNLWTGSCMTAHKDTDGMGVRVAQFGRAKDTGP